MLCVRQCCERRMWGSDIWAAAGRQCVQHSDNDAGCTVGRCNSHLNVDSNRDVCVGGVTVTDIPSTQLTSKRGS